MSDYSYKEQWDCLKVIKLAEGASLRLDCPFCHGNNSFGISRNGGRVSWGCFRASCAASGHAEVGYTRAGVRARLGYDPKIKASIDTDRNKVPDPLVSIDHNPDILRWLETVNSLRAYNSGLVEIKYSPTEDRVMFHIPNKNGYIGRALNSIIPNREVFGPKWKKFGDTSSIFQCGTGTTGVIVEDAPSACAVGVVEGLTGVALLGTMLTYQHKVDLRQFNKLIVCLDPDAAMKSIGLSKRIQGLSNVSVKFIPDDLKYYSPEKIQELLS